MDFEYFIGALLEVCRGQSAFVQEDSNVLSFYKSTKGKILLSSKNDVITLFFLLLSLLLHIAVSVTYYTYIIILLLQHIEVVRTLSAALSLLIFVSFNANTMVLFHHKHIRIDTAI